VHIGLIGPYRPDMFLNNIGDALHRMGHQVTHLGSLELHRVGRIGTRLAQLTMAAVPQVEDGLQHRLVTAARWNECDAVITTEGGLAPATVAALRRHRLPVALWFSDAVVNMGRQRMLTAPYSALFFKDPVLVQRLRDTLGLPVWYLPEACNPRWHRPIGAAGTERAVVVVGNTYLSRVGLLQRLHAAGVPLRIYGGPPTRWTRGLLPPQLFAGRAVFCEEKSEVFRSAAAVLNNLHPAEIAGVNCRLFEASGAGAAVLCERRPALGDLFDLDREVVPFSTFSELLDRAWELLGNSRLTEDYGDAASKRAHAEHTYDLRLPLILEKLQ
jgi:spore maturation protein CgeB